MSPPVPDLRLYLVTDVDCCGDRGVYETVRSAVAGGVTTVQLRDHRATTRELYDAAVELRELLVGSAVTFVVDDRLDVALAAGAGGVHLGQSDLPVERARAVGGPDIVIGLSVTNREQAERAGELPIGTVDYLGVGPVFPTTTKLDAAPPIGLDGLAAICAASPLPCVAIGGIGEAQVDEVISAGAVGVAVVSALCASTDPERAAQALRGRVERGRVGR